MIDLLYTPDFPCEETLETPDCDSECNWVADDMKTLSNKIALASVGTIVGAMIGYVLLFYGFGTATEKMNKRVRCS
jgi:ATP-binding cassette subfamily B (MDR/TAP) protein 1